MGKNKMSPGKQMALLVVCLIVIIIIAGSNHFEGPFLLMILAYMPAFILGVIRFVKYTKTETAAANDRKQKEIRDAFYEKCKSYQITSLTSAADYQKAETIQHKPFGKM